MQPLEPSWYSARTKPKHEHIAAANVRRHLKLPVFLPRIRLEKMTRRGLMRVAEPLFPVLFFVRCVVEERVTDIQHLTGISRLVQFGGRYPKVPDAIIEELQSCFGREDLIMRGESAGAGRRGDGGGGSVCRNERASAKKHAGQEKGSNLARAYWAVRPR